MTAVTPALVYNPRAGRVLRSRPKFERAVDVLRETWPGIRLIETTGPRTAGPLAKAAVDDGADLVIACGGDGTVNEVAQSLSGTGVPVGILPGGTANVLANEVSLGNDLPRAARLLADAEPCDVATGVLHQGDTETRFIMMAGIGFDALLVHELDLATKEKWGKLAYWWAAIRQMATRLQPFDVLVDGVSMQSTFTLVSRLRNYGGDVEIARGASLLENEFEVVVFDASSVVRLAWLFATGVVTGTLDRRGDVRILKARRVELKATANSLHVQVDGEAAGFAPATIDLVPGSMRLLLPRTWLRLERKRLVSH